MSASRRMLPGFALAALCAVWGCGGRQAAAPTAPRAPQQPESKPLATAAAAPAATGAEPSEVAETSAEQFQPPYPHRTDPFQRPNVTRTASEENSSRGAQVELRGFINVDGLKALLAIDGQLASVAAGGEQGGIEVIEIAPPRVILQRGRTRWTATLFEVVER